MSDLTLAHAGDVPVPLPTPGTGTLNDVHYPPLPSGQGFHFVTAAGPSAAGSIWLITAMIVFVIAAVFAARYALRRLPRTSLRRSALAVWSAALCCLLVVGVAVTVVGAMPAAAGGHALGYSQFHKWAKDRYSIDIDRAGYDTLVGAPGLAPQPTTTAYMGQRIEVSLVHGDDGLGYLVGSVGTVEMPVKPNSYGQSTVSGQGENGSGSSTGPGGIPLGTPQQVADQQPATPREVRHAEHRSRFVHP